MNARLIFSFLAFYVEGYFVIRFAVVFGEERLDDRFSQIMLEIILAGFYMIAVEWLYPLLFKIDVQLLYKAVFLFFFSIPVSRMDWKVRALSISIGLFFSLSLQNLTAGAFFVINRESYDIYDSLRIFDALGGWGVAQRVANILLQIAGAFLLPLCLKQLNKLETRYSILLSLLALFGCFCCSLLKWMISSGDPNIREATIIIAWIGQIVSVSAAIYAFRQIMARREDRLERQMILRLNEEIRRGYELLAEKNDELRIQSHDFRNHLIGMQNMTEEEMKAYLHDLLDHRTSMKEFCHSGNKLVDAVINSKVEEMMQNHIRFDQNFRLPEEIQIPPTDLCAIISNQMDNAIEACEKIPVEADRWIRYTIDTRGDILSLTCENSIVPGSVSIDVPLKTSKTENKDLHGFGVKSIRSSAERNGGRVHNEVMEDRFVSRVILENLRVSGKVTGRWINE